MNHGSFICSSGDTDESTELAFLFAVHYLNIFYLVSVECCFLTWQIKHGFNYWAVTAGLQAEFCELKVLP